MPRRMQIRVACTRCRKKRAKCDGREPCRRCGDAHEECTYDRSRRESKGDLRAEIRRLKLVNEENNRLLLAIASLKDTALCQSALAELLKGTTPRHSILQQLCRLSIGATPPGASQPCLDSARASTSPPCYLGSSSSSIAYPGYDDDASESEFSSLSPTLTSPSLVPLAPLSRPDDDVDIDRWTTSGLTIASVQHHFDSLSAWDQLPFCLLNRDLFLWAYHEDSHLYCSSALVNALLALATLVVREQAVDHGPSRELSCAFFTEAQSILKSTTAEPTLPDIQALGIMSLYKMSDGCGPEAQRLAHDFKCQIQDLCCSEHNLDDLGSEYVLASTVTRYGAISLSRLLELLTGGLGGLHFGTSAKPCFDEPNTPPKVCQTHNCQDHLQFYQNLASETATSHLHYLEEVPAKMFQLTEWVHKLLAAVYTPSIHVASDDVLAAYQKFLGWYDDLFTIASAAASDKPFVVFVHMYYQFCLLCLFWPFVNCNKLAGTIVQPREICLQAAQAIADLNESYRGSFGEERVPALVPYIVKASGFAIVALGKGAGVKVET
ncbi:hypothetical protein CDD81_1290 [Ophiocordyceps australis]|uniref:Zn(2)-C6 fungal-type domain-containing protein n=1 Tax=Ophiocordyceps australis TaxID=1399860 RepID=A0A2C5Y0L1_9HYPO|nr:hypothetical protein CDD81_1290 [Ophiocordyceps australis]